MPTNRSKKILVTSGGWQGALTTVQSLGRLGHHMYLLGTRWDIPTFYSRFCKGRFICPEESNEQPYLEFVLNLLKSNRFDALIPISDQTVSLFSRHRELLLAHTCLHLAPQDILEIAGNKTKTYRFALENNIPIPETYFPGTNGDVAILSQKDIFPCVVKYPTGTASNNVFIIDSPQQLKNFFNSNQHQETWPIVQRKIESDFYGFTGVCRHGEILDYFMFRTDYQHSHGGTPPYAYSFVDENLLKSARLLLHKLNFTGSFDLDYMKGKSGEFLLLEINPRFSGTLNFSYKLGIDLPRTYLGLILGDDVTARPHRNYKSGILHRSVFPEEIRWSFKNKKCLQFWLNFLKLNSKINVYWDDPNLLKWQIKESVWTIRNIKSKTHEKNKIS